MKNMKKEFLIVVALLIATVFVISACNSSGEAARKAINVNINANECRADDSCEMENAEISGGLSTYSLSVGSSNNNPVFYINVPGMNSGFVVNTLAMFNYHVGVQGGLSVDTIKVGNSPYSDLPAFYVNTIGQFDRVQVNTESDFNSKVNVNAALYAKTIKVGNLNTSSGNLPIFYVNIGPAGTPIVQVNGQATFNSPVEILDDLNVEGDLTLTNLATNSTLLSNAYVCVDSDGVLYRSETPCI